MAGRGEGEMEMEEVDEKGSGREEETEDEQGQEGKGMICGRRGVGADDKGWKEQHRRDNDNVDGLG